MSENLTIQACADVVFRGDKERFRATMAAPVAARHILFPIHAFCLEVAKAPWLTQESIIAEMRLQFWRDVLQEKIDGKDPRAHEVAAPLAAVIDDEAAAAFDATVVARKWDIYRDPHESDTALARYLTNTYALPMVHAARLLGAAPSQLDLVHEAAFAGALVRYFAAVPSLQEQGRIPFLDGRAAAVADLAERAISSVHGRGAEFAQLSKLTRAPLIDAMVHLPLLKRVVSDPDSVIEGRLSLTPLRQSLRLTLISQAPYWSFV